MFSRIFSEKANLLYASVPQPGRRSQARGARDSGCRRPALLGGNFSFAQAGNGGFRTYRRVINLFKGVRPIFRNQDRHDLDVPVIVVVDRLPIAQTLRTLERAGGGVNSPRAALCSSGYTSQAAREPSRAIRQS